MFLSGFDFGKSLYHPKPSQFYFSVVVISSARLAYMAVPPNGVIALIRQPSGVRSREKDREVAPGAIRKLRK
jgi:hypothetical protein